MNIFPSIYFFDQPNNNDNGIFLQCVLQYNNLLFDINIKCGLVESGLTNPLKVTVRIIQGDDDLFTYAFLCKFDIISAFIAGFSSIPFYFRKSVDY